MKTLNDYVESTPEEFRQEELILEATELIARVMNQNGIACLSMFERPTNSHAENPLRCIGSAWVPHASWCCPHQQHSREVRLTPLPDWRMVF
jgi:hypothetical protein